MSNDLVNFEDAVGQSASTEGLGLVERLRGLDKKGYESLTGAIGEEAADLIDELRKKLISCRGSVKAEFNTYERFLLNSVSESPLRQSIIELEAQRLYDLLSYIDDVPN